MKKYLSLALALAMLVSSAALAACGDDEATDTNPPAQSSTPASNSGDTTTAPEGDTTTAPEGDTTEGDTPDPSQPEEKDPLSEAYDNWEASLRSVDDAIVENKDEFKADANNQNLMTDYFEEFNTSLTLYVGFDYTDAEDEQVELGNEGAHNIFDQNTATKWCGGAQDNEFKNAIVWSMTDAVKLTGYSFTSGNDNSQYTTRNPITWRLYGANELPETPMNTELDEAGNTYFEYFTVPEGWTRIDGVNAIDDNYESKLPDLDFEETIFSLPETVGPYKYFMFMIDTNEDNCIQISELTLYGTVAE